MAYSAGTWQAGLHYSTDADDWHIGPAVTTDQYLRVQVGALWQPPLQYAGASHLKLLGQVTLPGTGFDSVYTPAVELVFAGGLDPDAYGLYYLRAEKLNNGLTWQRTLWAAPLPHSEIRPTTTQSSMTNSSLQFFAATGGNGPIWVQRSPTSPGDSAITGQYAVCNPVMPSGGKWERLRWFRMGTDGIGGGYWPWRFTLYGGSA